jgi:hypothetical protein
MQRSRRLIGALVLGLAVSGYAEAANYSVVFDSSNSFEKRHDKIPQGNFTDVYSFNLATPSELTISFKNDWKVLAGLTIFVDGFGAKDYGPISVPASGSPNVGTFSLLAGAGQITFSGRATDKDGRYTIRLLQTPIASAPVPAVPEPAEWTMLLAGFLVIGFIVRRRSRSSR